MSPISAIIISCLAALAAVSVRAEQPSCFDEDGNIVDWFIAYKFPVMAHKGMPWKTGHAYAYITSAMLSNLEPGSADLPESTDLDSVVYLNQFKDLLHKYVGSPMPTSVDKATLSERKSAKGAKERKHIFSHKSSESEAPNWVIGKHLLSDKQSAIMRSLSMAYRHGKGDGAINTIFYSDQPPVEGKHSSQSRAHAKGAIIIDDQTGHGMWLSHSTPLFPPPRDEELKFADNSKVYGQTFMCLNFDLNRSGAQIANHLANMHPYVYDSHLSDKLLDDVPEFNNLVLEGQKRRRKVLAGAEEGNMAQTITTRDGQDLKLFSKSKDYTEDIYSTWLDQELQDGLFVATWRNGAGNPLPSSCPKSGPQVNNVLDLKVNEDHAHIEWSYRQDHSKWAITESQDAGVVCISDINRMESQFKRGGGAICIKCPRCWTIFSGTIADLEPCPKKKSPAPRQNANVLDQDAVAKLDEVLANISI